MIRSAVDQRHDEHLNCSLFPVSSSLICLCYLSIGLALLSLIVQTKHCAAHVSHTQQQHPSRGSWDCPYNQQIQISVAQFIKLGWREDMTKVLMSSWHKERNVVLCVSWWLDTVTLLKLGSNSFSMSWHRVTYTLSKTPTIWSPCF